MSNTELTVTFSNNALLDSYLSITCAIGGLGGMLMGLIASFTFETDNIKIISLPITIPLGGIIGFIIGPIIPPSTVILLLYSWYKEKVNKNCK